MAQTTTNISFGADGPRAQTDQRAGNVPDLASGLKKGDENKISKETLLTGALASDETVLGYDPET